MEPDPKLDKLPIPVRALNTEHILFLIQSQFGGGPGEKGTFDTNGEFPNPGKGLQAGGPV